MRNRKFFSFLEVALVLVIISLSIIFARLVQSGKQKFDESRLARYTLWIKMSGRSDISQKEFEILNVNDKLINALPPIKNADPEKREE